jgi:YbgC/YbaW family acyl-CoA thioester hydrolase
MSELFRVQRLVEFSDTDMAGIVHFAEFFRYMEAAEHAFLRARGLSVSMDWEGERISFPRVAASCDYLRPAHFEDVLDIGVRLERLGSSSVTYAFEISKGGEPVARGRLTTVCCRMVPGKGPEPRPIPDALRAKLQGEG